MTPSTDKKKIITAAAVALFWIIVWGLAAHIVGQELILPSPKAVLNALIRLAGEGSFWRAAAGSLLRILGGFAAGTAVGTILAVLTVRFGVLDALFTPVIRIVRATPVASFIILALLWIGKVRVPGFIAALMVTPVVCAAVQTAIRQTDPELLEMAKVYRFSVGKKLRLIYVPSVMPTWITACVTASGLAWKSGIAAEVLCQPTDTIGTNLHNSRVYLETAELFAWTAVVIVLSYIIEVLFVRLVKGRWGR